VESIGRHLAPASLWVDGSSCLVTGQPNPPGYTGNLSGGSEVAALEIAKEVQCCYCIEHKRKDPLLAGCDAEVKGVDEPKEECSQSPRGYAENICNILRQEKFDVVGCGVCEEYVDANFKKQICEQFPERGELILKPNLPPSLSYYHDATCHYADHCKDEIGNFGYEGN